MVSFQSLPVYNLFRNNWQFIVYAFPFDRIDQYQSGSFVVIQPWRYMFDSPKVRQCNVGPGFA